MPTKPKTLYTKTNPVDITNVLTTKPKPKSKSKKMLDNYSESGSGSESDHDSWISESEIKKPKSKSKQTKTKKKNQELGIDDEPDDNDEENEENDEDTQENTEDVVDDVVDADDNDEDVGVKDESNESDEEVENDDKSINSNDDKETVGADGKCYSKYAKEENIDLDEYFRDDDIVITKNGRVGKPILFKYERVRLLSDRSRQLAEGAKPMIKNTVGLSHKEIALLELKNKLIPLIIERPIPNSGNERWRLSELEIPDID